MEKFQLSLLLFYMHFWQAVYWYPWMEKFNILNEGLWVWEMLVYEFRVMELSVWEFNNNSLYAILLCHVKTVFFYYIILFYLLYSMPKITSLSAGALQSAQHKTPSTVRPLFQVRKSSFNRKKYRTNLRKSNRGHFPVPGQKDMQLYRVDRSSRRRFFFTRFSHILFSRKCLQRGAC